MNASVSKQIALDLLHFFMTPLAHWHMCHPAFGALRSSQPGMRNLKFSSVKTNAKFTFSIYTEHNRLQCATPCTSGCKYTSYTSNHYKMPVMNIAAVSKRTALGATTVLLGLLVRDATSVPQPVIGTSAKIRAAR